MKYIVIWYIKHLKIQKNESDFVYDTVMENGRQALGDLRILVSLWWNVKNIIVWSGLVLKSFFTKFFWGTVVHLMLAIFWRLPGHNICVSIICEDLSL